MKKLLFLLIVFISITASEAKTLKVISGSTKFFTEQNEKFKIIINWNKAVVAKKSVTMEDYYKAKGEKDYADWQEGIKFSNIAFCKYFNEKKSKKTKMLASNDEKEQVKYCMDVNITKIELGSNTGVILGVTRKQGGMRIYGTATIKDIKTGEKVVVFDMVKVKSLGIPSVKGRMGMTCRYLADGLIKEIK